MSLPPWAWIAGAATLALGGGIAYANTSAPAAAAGPPPGPTPATPIPVTQGHRYQVTLTFGGPTTAAALLANVVPNIQAGLNAVAPNEFAFVHAIAPNATQIVYVVDAVGGAPGTTLSESPQVFFADLNAATFGGIGVQVSDLGPTPAPGTSTSTSASSPGPGGSTTTTTATTSPGSGTTTTTTTTPAGGSSPGSSTSTGGGATTTPISIATLVTDPNMVSSAQVALNAIQGTATVPTSGIATDAATAAAVAAFQNKYLPANPPPTPGLTYLTWAYVIVQGIAAGGHGTDATFTDARSITFAQEALAVAIGAGVYPSIDYGTDQVNGVPTDPAWMAALGAAMTQGNATLAGTPVKAPVDGTLDYVAFALLIGSAYTPPVPVPVGGTIIPIEPAETVTDAAWITAAQQELVRFPQSTGTRTPAQNAIFAAVVVNGNASDPATVAALTLYQSTQPGLQHRTTPGVLDFLTFSAVLLAALMPSTPPLTTQVPTAALVTDPAAIAGAQEALILVAGNGRIPGTNAAASYTRSMVDGNAGAPAFASALSTVMGAINQSLASAKLQLPTARLDLNVFATLFGLAYL